MDGEWQTAMVQYKRAQDVLFERHLEEMKVLWYKNHDKNHCDITRRAWNPLLVPAMMEIVGAPPEGEYSSSEMDRIRKLQQYFREMGIRKKWKNLGEWMGGWI